MKLRRLVTQGKVSDITSESLFLRPLFSFLFVSFFCRYVGCFWFRSAVSACSENIVFEQKHVFFFSAHVQQKQFIKELRYVHMYTRKLDLQTCMHPISDVNIKTCASDVSKTHIKNWLLKISYIVSLRAICVGICFACFLLIYFELF